MDKKPKPAAGTPPENASGPPDVKVLTYDYTDESGALIFQAVREERDAGGKKKTSVKLRRPDKRHGWSYGVPELIKGSALFKVRGVQAAIQAGGPVFLVDSEYDVNIMGVVGLTATTQAGGSGSWKAGHAKRLTNADVVILGRTDAEQVAESLSGIAKRVRLIDATKAVPTLKPGASAGSLFEAVGAEKGKEFLEQLAAQAEDYKPKADETRDREKAFELYDKLPGYCVDKGCICQSTDETPKRLCTFVAVPSAVVLRDDGVNIQKVMVIDGWSQSGEPLPQARVLAKDFKSLGWVMENWDFLANIMPGQATVDRLRYAIAEIGRNATRRTEYTHTGWRKIGGGWCYLYHGGAIGAEAVSVDLGSGMQAYRLDGGGEPDFAKLTPPEGLAVDRMLEAIVAEHIAIPLLAMMFLAPLRDALMRGGIAPSFSIFLHGSTGTRKSTVSALALSHFGAFNARNLPASFQDTANYVRKKAFLLKDMPIVVDDYHPVTSQQERRKREDTAQSLSRAFGDGSERGRMNSSLQLQEAMPPRCLAILSGEDMPVIGESGMARYYIINVGKEDVPLGEEMTYMQDMARDGYLQRAMRGYIEWLLPRMDALPTQLVKRFKQYRGDAQKAVAEKGAHARMPEVIAHLMIGYEQMTLYMIHQGVMTETEGADAIDHAWRVIVANTCRQSDEAKDDRPSRMYLTALQELITTKAVFVRDLAATDTGSPGGKQMIGYMDAGSYYLIPGMSYSMVSEIYRRKGMEFPLREKGLYKQMVEDNVLIPDLSAKRSTKVKLIDGRAQRLLWIPRRAIDGPVRQEEQLSINPIREREPGEDDEDDETPF